MDRKIGRQTDRQIDSWVDVYMQLQKMCVCSNSYIRAYLLCTATYLYT